MNDTMYATLQHNTMETIGHFQLLVSRFIVATVAKHGIYNNTNAKNEYAASGVNIPCNANVIPAPASATPKSELNVDTTTSLASTPNNIATDGCHWPQPKGLNIGAINDPICPVKLNSDP